MIFLQDFETVLTGIFPPHFIIKGGDVFFCHSLQLVSYQISPTEHEIYGNQRTSRLLMQFYFYQILTVFNNLKIMSEVAHAHVTGFMKQYMIEETEALNVSTERLITMCCGSQFQSRYHTREKQFQSLQSDLHGGKMKTTFIAIIVL